MDYNVTRVSDTMLRAWEKTICRLEPKGEAEPFIRYLAMPFLLADLRREKTYAIASHLVELHKDMGIPPKALMRDLVWCHYAFGAEPDEYFAFRFYGKKNLEKRRFVTCGKRIAVYRQFNDDEHRALFDNKLETARAFSQFYRRELHPLLTQADLEVCVDFLRRRSEVMLKPLEGALGRGIQRIRLNELLDVQGFLLERLREGPWLLEERISQCHELAHIFPNAVNTVRITTVRSRGGNVKVVFPLLRMGRGDMVVDNQGSGGISAKIDVKTGIVFGNLYPAVPGCAACHPDTGAQIIGFQIPRWQELIDLVRQLALIPEKFRMVGWDMALSEDRGWVMIEGNCRVGITSYQEIDQIGMADEYKRLIQWANEN